MKPLRKYRIKRKLTLVIMLTSSVSLLLASAAFLAFDFYSHREEMVHEMSAMAHAIADNCADSLAAGDRAGVGRVLGLLQNNLPVVAAYLYSSDGSTLAKYVRPDADKRAVFSKPGAIGQWFRDGYLIVSRAVVSNGKVVGSISLQCDSGSFRQRFKRYAVTLCIILLAASVAAYLLASRLQRLVSVPILSLTRVARVITEQKDYSIRVEEKFNDDEIDLLIDAFNQMLTQIHERDVQLQKVKDELEKRVQARTYALQQELAERKRTEEQLRQSQKMEAVGRLAGGVAHDFNNLLTVITGYSDLLLRRLSEDDPQRRSAQEIQTAAHRAASLTRQLLAFSRKQVLQPKVLDLNVVVAGMEKMLRRLIGEDVELKTVLAPTLGKIKADPGQIEQVIMNLVINSRDAMPSGGKIIITTAAATIGADTTFQDGENDPGEYVTISVKDTGLGMTPEVKAHLFEPFFTTKGKDKGTGLGLPTCYGIVKQSGGHIDVFSESDKGTTFKIFLRRVEKAAEQLAEYDEAKLLPRGKETLLVVEDEPAVRELAACVLRESGYKVLEAGNGREALRVVEEHGNKPIELLISDVIMPHMSGKELVDRMKTTRPKTKVLFISGYTDDAIVLHGALAPGVDYLEKPFSPARLVHRVREILDRPLSMAV
jgi:signal transduction histidine kinase